ncbi:hypothetical protein [Paraburkholderia caballeronis]|uniref:hypothetical protein n=1 Tax=Paraburkholderia caballeronis TaxID=416943 RepID=UPI0021ABFFCA|nr:hypothetical protein [Paraburkholderia caballeronis]
MPLRNGYGRWATAIAGNVETLASYSSGTQQKLFALAGGSVYDATAKADVGAPVIAGLTNSRWQSTNFENAGAQFLWMVNGVDWPLIYDGETWHTVRNIDAQDISSITASGTTATLVTAAAHGLTTGDQITLSGATPTAYNGLFTVTVVDDVTVTFTLASDPGGDATAVGTYVVMWSVTGVDPRTFVHVTSWGNRLWFTQAGTFRTWYLGVSAVSGPATAFDVGPQMLMGGFLQGIATWNIDDTAGLNEYICFVSSRGEVAVYQGSDPAQSSTFSISARFRIGAPVGRRFYEKFGSDVVFITADGLVPLSKALLTDREQTSIAITNKIMPSVNSDVMVYGDNFGWQPILFPEGNKIILNVPTLETETSYQYVMNTITSAWCRFTGWDAFCFCYSDKGLYFGGAGFVAQADVGADDGGAAIIGDIKPAFNYFGSRGVQKHFKMMRPILKSNAPFAPQIDASVDFDESIPDAYPTLSFGRRTPWDTTPWDQVPWKGDSGYNTEWQSIDGLGYAATYRMRTQTIGIQFSIQSVTFTFEPQRIPSF